MLGKTSNQSVAFHGRRMIAGFLLLCLLHLTCQEPNPGVLRELVISGWEEHEIPEDEISADHLKDIIYPGITLTNPAIGSKGSFRVTQEPKHKKTKFSDENTLEAVLGNMSTKYHYTMDNGEKGYIKVKVTNRTYSMKFQSILVEEDCRTALLYVKLAMEGPVIIMAKGDKSRDAVEIAEKIRYLVVLQSRSLAYFEIIKAMNESLLKRKPELCHKR